MTRTLTLKAMELSVEINNATENYLNAVEKLGYNDEITKAAFNKLVGLETAFKIVFGCTSNEFNRA